MSDIVRDRYSLLLGDCLERLKSIESNSVDSLVTDPPAGISFMGKDWDSNKGGSKEWINWLSEVLCESHRVLKPGAHGFIWALPRTSHWTAMAVEWSGLEIRDCITHLFGSGFPKSLDVSKAIDKSQGVEGNDRPIIGENPAYRPNEYDWIGGTGGKTPMRPTHKTGNVTEEAKQWEGWGTALKPASEFWWLVRKPISEKNIAANVLRWGTGAINIDASRIGSTERFNPPTHKAATAAMGDFSNCNGLGSIVKGRFPANLILSHRIDCFEVSGGSRGGSETAGFQDLYVGGKVKKGVQRLGYEDESPEVWHCHPECPIAILDGQSGQSPGIIGAKQTGSFEFHAGVGGRSGKGMTGGKKDFGGASRFFYTAKPSNWERDAGLSDLAEGKARSAMVSCNGQGDQRLDGKPITTRRNIHPTVKSFALMRYLVTMITPPGGTVLDCFLGSGTTGAVAVACGFRFIGIERQPEYLEIASRRIADVRLQPKVTKE